MSGPGCAVMCNLINKHMFGVGVIAVCFESFFGDTPAPCVDSAGHGDASCRGQTQVHELHDQHSRRSEQGQEISLAWKGNIFPN